MLFQWRVAQGHYPHSELWLNLWEREMVPVPALLTNLLCMFVFVSCDCVQTVDSNSQAFIAKVKKNWPWTGKTFWGGRFNEVFDMVSKQFMSGHTQIWGWQWCCVLRRATWNKKLSHSSQTQQQILFLSNVPYSLLYFSHFTHITSVTINSRVKKRGVQNEAEQLTNDRASEVLVKSLSRMTEIML